MGIIGNFIKSQFIEDQRITMNMMGDPDKFMKFQAEALPNAAATLRTRWRRTRWAWRKRCGRSA
jgi:hypothetical protein